MKWFMNITIKWKLFGVMILVLILLITLASASYISISSILKSQKTLVERNFVEVYSLLEMKKNLDRSRALILRMITTGDRNIHEAIENELKDRNKKEEAAIQKLEMINSDGNEFFMAHLLSLKSEFSNHVKIMEEQIALIRRGKTSDALRIDNGIQEKSYNKIRKLIIELENAKKREMKHLTDRNDQTGQTMALLILALGATSIFAGMFIVWFMNRIITGPLRRLTTVAERIASGDLTTEVPVELRKDEIGSLVIAFKTMLNTLRDLTADISEGVGVLGTSAGEIVTTTTQVAASATETATAITETTTTVEEVRQTAQLSAQKARTVQDTANKSAKAAKDGQEAVKQTIIGMNNIQRQMSLIADIVINLSEQSRTIGEITATVTDIADQSNLLSVNAAIEAVKAGEQGIGFSVVAQEIKSLAEQSKQATTQVRGILNDIQKAVNQAVLSTEQGSKAVENGSLLSERSGEVITLLAETVNEAAQAATQIAASSQQQLVGMDQIAPSMENIKQAMIQNVASTEQSQKAAQNLHDLGLTLKQLVEKFQV